jgi:hypothetical protein
MINVKKITLLGFYLLFSSSLFAEEIKINGVYNGINLHIQNPHDGNGNYCISTIYVNGIQTKIPSSTVITLDLGSMNFKIGDKIEIKIIHQDKCKPKIINPNALLIRGDFHFGKLKVDDEGLYWEGRGEGENGQYFIETFKNSSWQAEKAILAKGTRGINSYTLQVNHIAGLNKYRIKYVDSPEKFYYSDEIEFISDKEKVYFYPKNVSTTIYFSKVVKYEILDLNHKTILKGSGNEIDCTSLLSGTYYLLYDNRTEQFYKKPN